jgi:sugar O-acyltransferase (sialic acid O-acetyltransferase NeuD family)
MKSFVILGVGGNCIDILDTALALNRKLGREEYRCIGFLDDNPAIAGVRFHDVPVLGPLGRLGDLGDVLVVNGIGSTRNFWKKPAIIAQAGAARERYISLVHPSATVSAFAQVGAGSVLLQGAVVGAGARLGDHVMVLPLSIISHDAQVGDFSILAGGVCVNGGCKIGRCCYLGSGTQIKDGVQVAEYTLCGMGSNVLHDVGPRAVVAGNPARLVRALLVE